MTAPIVFVGVATYDAISLVPRYPRANERVEATAVVFAGGGPAATAAVAARRLGAAVELIAPVGDDPVHDLIAESLEREGVGLHLQLDAERASQASAIICASDQSTRAITTLNMRPFSLTERHAELVRGAEWVHVDHLGWPAVARALSSVPADRRPKISVDAGHPIIGDAALCRPAETALFVPPFENLVANEGESDPDVLRRVGADAVVATKGGSGCVGLSPDGRFHSIGGVIVPELGSTLGAGDVFHGALAAAEPFDHAMRLANVVAALSCRGVDGRSRIPDLAEADAFLTATTTNPPEERSR
ncbi:PfkB family carbohydrate kinase [Humibacter soli]